MLGLVIQNYIFFVEKFIKNLAKGAGKILRVGFRKKLETKEKKGFWDLVTNYDLAVDKFVTDRIRKKFPSHGIMSEESEGKKAKRFWILDPIDGTSNFSKGVAMFCTAIAFVSDDELEFGAIYEPITDELFYAKKGKGAFLNNKTIQVSSRDSLNRADLTIELWLQPDAYKFYTKILKQGILPPRNQGSACVQEAYTANGRFDGLVHKGGHPWDYAPGALIMKEAGAKVTDFKGRPYKWNFGEVLAANPKLHSEIIKALE